MENNHMPFGEINPKSNSAEEEKTDTTIAEEIPASAAEMNKTSDSTQNISVPYEILDELPKKENTYEEDVFSRPNFYDESDIPEKKKREKKPTKPLSIAVASAIAASLLTALLFTGLFAGLYYYIAPDNQSTIIYRDGNDLRTKTDLMSTLGIKPDGKEQPLTVTEVANRIGPTVVGISAEGVASTNSIFGIMQQPFASSGTGFIISTDGFIVTNNHVVEGASKVVVTLDNDNEYNAKVIGTDPRTDLAVLKIEETGLTPAVLGNSSDVQVGELAVAIGNPLGQTLSGTVTAGIISATNRKVTLDGMEYTLLQIDAAINSGNSGGPLANAYGEIIGINNAKIASSGVEGLGFAIPSDIAKPVIEDLIAVGYVRGRPLIGINGRNITQEMSEYYDLPIGVYVVSVEAFSAAENAGLRIGDVITECNSKKVTTVDELNEIRDEHKSGDELTLTIIRNKEKITISVILGEDRPAVSLN